MASGKVQKVPQTPPGHGELRGTGVYWGLAVALVLSVALVIGIVQNLQSVVLKFLVWDLETPMVVVLLGTIIATVVVSALVGMVWRRRRRRELTEGEELQGLRANQAASAAVATSAPDTRP